MDKQQVTRMLVDNDINPTSQRVEIAEYLLREPQHLTAEQILEGVNQQGAGVSKATVYNTLNLFAKKGVVRELLVTPERVIYDSNLLNHYHLYNVDTGQIQDIPTSALSVSGLDSLVNTQRLEGVDVIIKVRNA